MGPTSALEPRRRRRRNENIPTLQQTGIFDAKAERVETEINEARAMELEAQVFEAERARARGRTRSRPSSPKWRRGSRGLRSRRKSTCGFWGRSYRR